MEVLLAAPAPQDIPSLPAPLSPAHMAYRIGPGPRLFGRGLQESLRGGYMLVDCPTPEGGGDPEPCLRQILAECRRRQYRGIICDFEGLPSPCIRQLLTRLDQRCTAEGMALFAPESCASFAPAARVLISSALTSGTLERHLRAAIDRYGVSRAALAIDWLREDLPLPSECQRGAPITQQALEEQIRRLEPAVFFDRGLCANYYTYMAARNQAHFVLFDTPASVRAKLDMARLLELPAVLLAEPQVRHCLEEILK